MSFIASISYGKDSIAMLEVINQHGFPLDRIITIDTMATDEIPADMPNMLEFKRKADGVIKDRYGIDVEHIRTGATFERLITETLYNRARSYKDRLVGSPFDGYARGWPLTKHHWCSKALKIKFSEKLFRNDIKYIGIAVDEPDRFGQLNDKIKAPLVEYGVTEADAREICTTLDLLAPTYSQANRTGCFFCPYQPTDQLRKVRKEHRELWNLMLKWDEVSPTPFKWHKVPIRLADYDRRFELEDEGLAEVSNKFRWETINVPKTIEEFNKRFFETHEAKRL